MNISAKSSYGLRAILDLSLNFDQGYVQSSDIAARQNIPESYLVQLLNLMRKGGLVRSLRGPKGGHELAKPPDEVTIMDFLILLEGPIEISDVGEKQMKGETGIDVFQEIWSDVEIAIKNLLTSVSFGDLCLKYQREQKHFIFRI